MLEVQIEGADSNVYVATRLSGSSALAIEKKGISFLVLDQERWLQAFDRLKKAGIVEEVLTDEKHNAFENFKEGWAQIQRGEDFPYDELWERVEQ